MSFYYACRKRCKKLFIKIWLNLTRDQFRAILEFKNLKLTLEIFEMVKFDQLFII